MVWIHESAGVFIHFIAYLEWWGGIKDKNKVDDHSIIFIG